MHNSRLCLNVIQILFFQLQTLRFETNRKGTLNQMTSYWDAATAFEIAVLDKDFKRATDAALKMFKLPIKLLCPVLFYLKY